MKKFVAFVVAAAAVPALVGPSVAQSDKKPATPPAVTEADKKPAAAPAPTKLDSAREASVKNLAGEIVSMDHTARTVTVKHMVEKKAAQVTFNVEDAAVLAPFKAGDHVKVTYAEMGDKRIVKSIIKG